MSTPGVGGNGRRVSLRFASLRTMRRLASQLSSGRSWLLALGHLVLFAVVYWAAFGFRFDFAIPAEFVRDPVDEPAVGGGYSVPDVLRPWAFRGLVVVRHVSPIWLRWAARTSSRG